jgi:hypothetical protein
MTGAVTKDMITPRGCGQNQNQHLFITTLFWLGCTCDTACKCLSCLNQLWARAPTKNGL